MSRRHNSLSKEDTASCGVHTFSTCDPCVVDENEIALTRIIHEDRSETPKTEDIS